MYWNRKHELVFKNFKNVSVKIECEWEMKKNLFEKLEDRKAYMYYTTI